MCRVRKSIVESHSQVTKYRPVDSTIDFLTPESPSLPLINIQTNVNAHESAATVVLVIQHDVATLSWYCSGVECCRTCSWCPEYRTALLSITRHDHVHLIILLNYRLIYSLKNKEKCVSLLILDKLNDIWNSMNRQGITSLVSAQSWSQFSQFQNPNDSQWKTQKKGIKKDASLCVCVSCLTLPCWFLSCRHIWNASSLLLFWLLCGSNLMHDQTVKAKFSSFKTEGEP